MKTDLCLSNVLLADKYLLAVGCTPNYLHRVSTIYIISSLDWRRKIKVLTHESVTQAATCNLLPFVNKLKCIEKGINK